MWTRNPIKQSSVMIPHHEKQYIRESETKLNRTKLEHCRCQQVKGG